MGHGGPPIDVGRGVDRSAKLDRMSDATASSATAGQRDGMTRIPGGAFTMGTDDAIGYPADGEGPAREIELGPFWIDTLAVSNERFARFVLATGHVTEAERFGWSFVFAGLLPADFLPTRGVEASAVVATGLRRAVASSGGAALLARGPARPSGRPRVVERRARVLRVGGQAASHRSGVGARGARAGSKASAFRGETRKRPAASIGATSGRARFPIATRKTTAFSAPRRSPRSRPTASASTTPWGTCGSGAPTGSIRPSTRPVRAAIPPARPRVARASCAAARTCVIRRTATAIESRRAARTRRTARPATSAFAALPTIDAPSIAHLKRPRDVQRPGVQCPGCSFREGRPLDRCSTTVGDAVYSFDQNEP